MLRSSEILLAALLSTPVPAAAPGAPSALSLGRLSFAEQRVELASDHGWAPAREGTAVRLGARVRTGPESLARVELPWMAMTLGAASALAFPDEGLLSVVLDEGRVDVQAERREMLKLVTSEAEVRGLGRAVVRRRGGTTLVSALTGRFLVTAAGRTVTLRAGMGTLVEAGKPPRPPLPLPEPPGGLSPGSDPRFVAPGEAVSLDWMATTAAYQVEVLPVGSDGVLIQRDVGAPPVRLVIPWPGAFRWRVAARDANGLEGRASVDGLVCVDE